MEEQPRREVRPNTSIPIDKPSPTSDVVDNIRPRFQSQVSTAHGSAMAIQGSPEIASAERQESSSHSHDNLRNQQPFDRFDLHNGQTSVNIVNMVNVDDMIQPILPTLDFTPFDEQIQENTGNMVVDDMLQPILSVQDCGLANQQTLNNVNTGNVGSMFQPVLSTQGFTPLNEQMEENPESMVVDDVLQPILPTHVCVPPERQSQTDMANMVDIRDTSRPTLSQTFSLPNPGIQAMETAELHMFQSTTPVQAAGPVEEQTPTIHGALCPRTAESQNTHDQNFFYSRQPVPAA